MSADTLRRAAALMRERATAEPYDIRTSQDMQGWACDGWITEHDERASEHIASWHPAVALAVADWLDGIRFDHEYDANGIKRFCHAIEDRERALTVARAYLNESA